MVNFFKGKKTYFIGAAIFILGGFQALGFNIPPEIFVFLGGAGLTTLRAGISSK